MVPGTIKKIYGVRHRKEEAGSVAGKDKAAHDTGAYELYIGVEAGLGVDGLGVLAYGVDADVEFVGNLLVGSAFGELLDNFEFAGSELV